MPDSLPTLEAERSRLIGEFQSLGDLRPGSITAVARRCGKPNCHCAQPKDPGHDLQFRLKPAGSYTSNWTASRAIWCSWRVSGELSRVTASAECGGGSVWDGSVRLRIS
jgi:hypothetical protein